MRRLYKEYAGDRDLVLEAYVAADERGDVPRKRNANNTSSREYAVRLWANGVYHGWLSDEMPTRTTRTAQSRSKRHEPVELFEHPLADMGMAWARDPRRPRQNPEIQRHWSQLIDAWINADDMPLLIRKGPDRGLVSSHTTGRPFVSCDNSPAHWAFMGSVGGKTPTLDDVRDQLDAGQLPTSFARPRNVKALVEQGLHKQCGGFLSQCLYGQVNRFPDGRSYKLCHIQPVGMKSRGEVKNFDIDTLKAHMKLLLDPSNMLVVPLQYSGVGECKAFLDVAIETIRKDFESKTALFSEGKGDNVWTDGEETP